MIRIVKIAVVPAVLAIAVAAGVMFYKPDSPQLLVPEAQAQEEPAVAAEAPAAPAEPAPIVSTLPGGASSLNEQHGDWSVACGMTQAGKRCSFSQALVASNGGQRVLSLDLVPGAAGAPLRGTLLTPFSLRLDAGVSMLVDDQPLVGPVPFLTCAEVGCVVPLEFDDATGSALRAGKVLKVTATAVSGNQPIELSLSLTGFTAAANRVAELLK